MIGGVTQRLADWGWLMAGVDFTPLLTHTFSLDDIKEGYRVFGERNDGRLKAAVIP
jgi:threonine dehydrogenase-like Zn-dependent dehydrogenase